MQVIADTVDHVAQQVEAVNGQNHYADGIECGRAFLVVNGNDGIALLRCQSEGYRAVALVYGDAAVSLLETDDFLTGDRVAVGTEVEVALLLFGEVPLQKAFCFVGQDVFHPVGLGREVCVSANLHDVTAMLFRLDGSQLPVYTGIVCMFTDIAVNLEGEVQGRSPLGEVYRLSLGREDQNVIIIECRNHILDEVSLFLVELQILQHCAELVNPAAHIVLAALCHHSELGGTCHTFTADVTSSQQP